MKRIIVLAVCFLLFLSQLPVLADTPDYFYEPNDDGGVTITSYTGKKTADVIIPSMLGGSPVTRIASNAFINVQAIRSITLPDTVKSVEPIAFFGCRNLKTVYISAGTEGIEPRAFIACGISSIIVDPGNTNYAHIDGVLFNKIEKALLFYPARKEKEYTIPQGIKKIGTNAFASAQLTSVIIPNSVTVIEDDAFNSCSKLKKLELPSSIKHIGANAFYGCNALTTLTIPAEVESIGIGAFSSCQKLISIEVIDINNAYVSYDGVLFSKDNKELLAYPAGKKDKKYTLPSDTVRILDWAFAGSQNLRTLTIPASVTKIDTYTFDKCKSLTIHLASGSYAEQYCRERNLKYKVDPTLTAINDNGWLDSGNTTETNNQQQNDLSWLND